MRVNIDMQNIAVIEIVPTRHLDVTWIPNSLCNLNMTQTFLPCYGI